MVCIELKKFFFERNFILFRFDNKVILLVSGVVLIFVFVLTLVFGIIRIVKTTPNREAGSNVLIHTDESQNIDTKTVANAVANAQDTYALAEDITKLIIELVFTLFAILGTFALFRYIKAKYTAVPTTTTQK
jgi:hypothetical protein